MYRPFIFLFITILWLIPFKTLARQKADTATVHADTIRSLSEVTVRGYLAARPLFKTPASVGKLSGSQLGLQSDNSLVTAMNTVPGVRMEERSPGSYRLSIRGSTLRSPFGVRDVKIYFDEIPLTDAGGNTYLNAIDFNAIQSIEILKGPDGSIFGANSGGVMLISPAQAYYKDGYASGGINGGSYGLFHENAAFTQKIGGNQLNINQAYQTYNGYRQNSAMQRNYVQVVNQHHYLHDDNFKVMAFYSDLNYQTPGGLTLAQLQTDPQQARLGTKTVASAVDLKAAVHNQMLFGGIVNNIHLTDNLRNVLTVYGTTVDFTNPSFTTFEHRDENTYGLRTYFELSGNSQTNNLTWKANAGFEWQQTRAFIGNYGNKLGNKDTIQTEDHINTTQNFVFTRLVLSIAKRLEIEAALSLNNYDYSFKNQYPLAQNTFIDRPFDARLMPRLALAWQLNKNFTWRAVVSEGYSTPTTAEVRPTDHTINPTLQAQDGWNYETGVRIRDNNRRLFIDASVFYYRLNNAIVARMNPNETSHFVNAGGINQPGLELTASYQLIAQNDSRLIRGLQLSENLTVSRFTFRDYQDATTNYSGNMLTGVPQQVAVSALTLQLPKRIYLYAQHNYTGKLPLNDGNTVFADAYNLIDTKAGWRIPITREIYFDLYAGVDNILDAHYSLGNDTNAIGSRYYNPAAGRNWFAGMGVRF